MPARFEVHRETLTAELLSEEFAGEQEAIDDAGALGQARRRFDGAIACLAELPEGYRIERVRGRAGATRDPGCEMTLIDTERRPEQVVGKVQRRKIGRQMIVWTGAQLVEPSHAVAFSVVLRLAANDAEGRS